MTSPTINERTCETCEKTFLAEGEKNSEGAWVFSPVCYSCDEAQHQAVDDILKSRGWPEPE
jgi:hypothetical protein